MQMCELRPRGRHRRSLEEHRADLRSREVVAAFLVERVLHFLAHPWRLLRVARPEEQEEIAPVDAAIELLLPPVARIEIKQVLEIVDADRPQHLHALEDLPAVLARVGNECVRVPPRMLADLLAPRLEIRLQRLRHTQLDLDVPDRTRVERGGDRSDVGPEARVAGNVDLELNGLGPTPPYERLHRLPDGRACHSEIKRERAPASNQRLE